MTMYEPLKCLHVAGGRDVWVIRKSNGSDYTDGFKGDFEFVAYDGHPDSQAYARLFAAAPELLAALEAITDRATVQYGPLVNGLPTTKIDLARAVLAKAKGETP